MKTFLKGLFLESHVGESVSVTLKTYAHRSIPQLMVTELLVQNHNEAPIKVKLGGGAPVVTDDLDNTLSGDKSPPLGKDRRYMGMTCTCITFLNRLNPKLLFFKPCIWLKHTFNHGTNITNSCSFFLQSFLWKS